MEKCAHVRATHNSRSMISLHAFTFHQRWRPMTSIAIHLSWVGPKHILPKSSIVRNLHAKFFRLCQQILIMAWRYDPCRVFLKGFLRGRVFLRFRETLCQGQNVWPQTICCIYTHGSFWLVSSLQLWLQFLKHVWNALLHFLAAAFVQSGWAEISIQPNSGEDKRFGRYSLLGSCFK